MTFALTSPSFIHNAPIPTEFTGEGADASPELHWSDPPPATKEFALICDDPDAPMATWDHWVVFHIPANLRHLPPGIANAVRPSRPPGITQGKNSWGNYGYGGPMPPAGHGPHHYNFCLYALKEPIALQEGASKGELLAVIKGKVLARAKLTGLYERGRRPGSPKRSTSAATPISPNNTSS